MDKKFNYFGAKIQFFGTIEYKNPIHLPLCHWSAFLSEMDFCLGGHNQCVFVSFQEHQV